MFILDIFLRYRPKNLPEFPSCGHNTKSYRCSLLTMFEIKRFHELFYSKPNKISQDSFIFKFCSVGPTQRIKNPDSNRPRSMVISYFVLRENKSVVPVCKETFLAVLGITKHRVEGVMKRFFHKNQLPAENRGGDHISHMKDDERTSVIEFIKKITVLEKHYCRGRSARQYVASDLSIKKLWRMYNEENSNLTVKECFFRNIFNLKFNIGFSTPQVDVCSTCLEFKEKLKRENDDEKKIN